VGRHRKFESPSSVTGSISAQTYFFVKSDGTWVGIGKLRKRPRCGSAWAALYGVTDDSDTVSLLDGLYLDKVDQEENHRAVTRQSGANEFLRAVFARCARQSQFQPTCGSTWTDEARPPLYVRIGKGPLLSPFHLDDGRRDSELPQTRAEGCAATLRRPRERRIEDASTEGVRAGGGPVRA